MELFLPFFGNFGPTNITMSMSILTQFVISLIVSTFYWYTRKKSGLSHCIYLILSRFLHNFIWNLDRPLCPNVDDAEGFYTLCSILPPVSEQCWVRIRTADGRALFRLESFVFSFHDISTVIISRDDWLFFRRAQHSFSFFKVRAWI